ncbi:DedA family protein [Brevibacillus fluminis]|nr:DedA family protein [Brevibacillus fluminis]
MLHAISVWLDMVVTSMINSFGYLGVFIGMVLESACIPLPSEVIMLFGGYLVSIGKASFWAIFAAGTIGNIVGSIIIYWFGRKGGRTLLERYGKYVFIRQNHIAKADAWFAKYGGGTVFFCRCLPVVRTFISLPAGVSGMRFDRFVILTSLGSIPWNLLLTYGGYRLGENWSQIEPWMKPISYAILGGLVLAVLIFLFRNVKKTPSR